tara:strand:+ start:1649 stop:2224 length:576 start_codon:yes stop_codon:yes gene_type:complete
MSQDNVLRKEFSKKDVQRVRNLVQGKSNNRTTEGIGYSKKQSFYKEGDIWEEKGRKWTIKEGIKQNITKYDNIKKAIKIPLFCPNCSKQMKHKFDPSYYKLHKKCYDCFLHFSQDLRIAGVWDVYEKNIHNSDLDHFIVEFKTWFKEQLQIENKSFITEQGDVENWSGGINKERALKSLEKTIEYLKTLKK